MRLEFAEVVAELIGAVLPRSELEPGEDGLANLRGLPAGHGTVVEENSIRRIMRVS